MHSIRSFLDEGTIAVSFGDVLVHLEKFACTGGG